MDRETKEEGSSWGIRQINANRAAAKHTATAEKVINALHATGPES